MFPVVLTMQRAVAKVCITNVASRRNNQDRYCGYAELGANVDNCWTSSEKICVCYWHIAEKFAVIVSHVTTQSLTVEQQAVDDIKVETWRTCSSEI
jgi:hypothetical protein